MADKEHILVVEDEEHLAMGIKYNLDAEGYRVTVCGDGRTAIKLLTESTSDIDLVVLDLMLPGMSGYAVCESLRAIDREMPVLILSARTLAEDRTRGFDVGANQYMSKPFDLDEFISRVRNLLTFSPRRGENRGPPKRSRQAVRVCRGEDRLRDFRGPCQRRVDKDDAARADLAAIFHREPGPRDSPPRAAGKGLGNARQYQHPGPGPVHPPAAEDFRARPGTAAALPHDSRRRLPLPARG